MRLRDILSVFSRCVDNIVLAESGITNDANNRLVAGIVSFRRAIQELEATGAFKEHIDDIRNINKTIFMTHEDSLVLSKDLCVRLVSLLSQLRNKVNIAVSVLSAVLPPQDQNSISIKLPKIHDLKELSNISERLDRIFDQLIVNDFVKGKVSLQNLDTGSEWLEVVFNSAKAAGVVASVVYSVIYLQGEYIKNQEAVEVVRNRRIANDIYEKLSNQLIEENKKQLDEQAIKIAKEAGAVPEDKDYHEYSQRVKFCITEIDELVKLGLKFFPASTSPNEIQRKLPDFSKNSIEEMLPDIKKLPEKTSESETTEDKKS
ncbi:MAG: hypothetical protein CDV28_14610 [Candidatus Electronema aureum]|uniref:Uncharacterized protein n=1 Tax=Candidatus Electronema aureum TaxID=2005002 RepID=A0A521FYW5_9BACT|nr:MAG: hypothetical protein CDV28_14610 [Candidatus Electronema aureum]